MKSGPKKQLDRERVRMIKGLLKDGVPVRLIARAFGCSQNTVYGIATGRVWGNVKGAE